jgi:hypothetical protein
MADKTVQATPPDVIAGNKMTARRVFEEVWNRGNFDVMQDLFASTDQDHRGDGTSDQELS